AADVRDLGPVIDRYLGFLDRELADLLAAFRRAPNVMIVADHGSEAIYNHSIWRGWHSRHGGVFLAAGPDVPHRPGEIHVSYFDVLPTLTDLAGFEPLHGEGGTSLRRGS